MSVYYSLNTPRDSVISAFGPPVGHTDHSGKIGSLKIVLGKPIAGLKEKGRKKKLTWKTKGEKAKRSSVNRAVRMKFWDTNWNFIPL